MTEYWISQKKYFCPVCKCYMSDNKMVICPVIMHPLTEVIILNLLFRAVKCTKVAIATSSKQKH
ncbi:MAG: hypothetical protein RIS22_77 [Actinomycetota bacterium]